MTRTALMLLLTLSLLPVATGAEEDRDRRFVSAWERLLDEQLSAVNAELELRRLQQESLQQFPANSGISAAERQQMSAAADQAARWAHALRRQREFLSGIQTATFSDSVVVQLRVPGLPLAFVDDTFSAVSIPQSPEATRILHEIDALLAEQEQTSGRRVRQRALRERLQDPVVRPAATVQQQTSRDVLQLQQSAILFAPMAVEEALLRPVRRCVVLISDTDSANNTTGWSKVARAWVLESRRLLMAQLDHSLATRQSQTAQPAELQGQTAQPAERQDSAAVDPQAARLNAMTQNLERELQLIGASTDSATDTSAVRLPAAGRLALLMRMTKDSWDSVRQELTVVQEDLEAMQTDNGGNPETETASATNSATSWRMQEQTQIADAMERQLAAEMERRRAAVRYAMALYRLETGKDSDAAIVRTERTNLFTLAARRQADLDLIAVQQELTEVQLRKLQQSPLRGAAEEEQIHDLAVEVAVFRAEYRRMEIQMTIAGLCLRLMRLADAEPAVALH